MTTSELLDLINGAYVQYNRKITNIYLSRRDFACLAAEYAYPDAPYLRIACPCGYVNVYPQRVFGDPVITLERQGSEPYFVQCTRR